jgi:hypothetical protein
LAYGSLFALQNYDLQSEIDNKEQHLISKKSKIKFCTCGKPIKMKVQKQFSIANYPEKGRKNLIFS